MFENPALFASASDLGLAAGFPQSGVYRWFETVGLGPPKRMFIAARILNAYSQFKDSRLSVLQVSDRLGYSNPRVLGLHAYLSMQVRPSGLRYLAKTDLLERLRVWATLPCDARQ